MVCSTQNIPIPSLTTRRYGGTLMAKSELHPFNFLVVYLAIIQGSLAAGTWLSFGPSTFSVFLSTLADAL
jgi:hypothetical protein